MRNSEKIALGIILLSFVIGVYFYSQMEEMIASHWNLEGQVDGYMSKLWGLVLMPFLSLGFLLIFAIIPRIDPLKSNIEKFRKYYDRFVLLLIGFLFYIYLLTILWNIGMRFYITQLLAPALGILIYYCGILLENTRRNWFIGIRTPWTLSNEKVWEKTNKLGGKLFKIIGIVAIFAALFRSYVLALVIIPLILVVIYTVVYSYLEYKKKRK